MKPAYARIVLPIATSLLGILWIVVGLVFHGWWAEGRPQSGFFPTIAGGVLLFVSVLAIPSEIKGSPPEFFRSHLYPVLAAIGMVLLSLLVGFFPALVVYVFGWVRGFEKYSLPKSLLITAMTAAFMYGVFRVWLRVPFPSGLIFNLI